jgi:hypothetical protein
MILGKPRRTTGPRRLRSALLVAATSAIALLGAAGTASAGPTLAQANCPDDALCLWDGTNFTGDRLTVSSFGPTGTCVSLVDHGWGDRARSARNTHENSAAMFMNDDCIGGPFQVAPNAAIPDFGTFRPESVWVPTT